MFMCKDRCVSHTFLFQMFITYTMHTIVTTIKGKKGCREIYTFKERFNCFN